METISNNPEIIRKTASFIFNKNIDIIDKIYQEDGEITSITRHLIEKKEHYKSKTNNKSTAWLYFIMSLDKENLTKLYKYIANY